MNIWGLGAALVELERLGVRPDCYAGTSAGAYLSFVAAVAGAPRIKIAAPYVDLGSVFPIKPVRDSGGFSIWALLRMLTFRGSLGVQDARGELKKIISEREFLMYQNSNRPNCYVSTVGLSTGLAYFYNLKTDAANYQEAIDMVEASSRIVPMVNPIVLRGEYCADGGHRNHNPSEQLLGAEPKIQCLFSLYARPKEGDREIPEPQAKAQNWAQRTLKIIEIAHSEVSYSDEKISDLICDLRNIRQIKIHLPKILTHYYDTNPQRCGQLVRAAQKIAQKLWLPL